MILMGDVGYRKKRFSQSFIELEYHLWSNTTGSAYKLLILLPHCIQDFDVDQDHRECEKLQRLGKCEIKDLNELSDHYQ